MRNNFRAQTLMEYAILLGMVTIVLIAMSPLLRRGVQGMVRTVADQVGVQKNSEQAFDDSGHLISAYSATRTVGNQLVRDVLGTMNYIYADEIQTDGNTQLNLGFTERRE